MKSVCVMNQELRQVKILRSLNLGCIQKVVDSGDPEAKRKQRFVCPTCRNIIKYGDEGIIGLPKNTSLEHLVKR